MSKSIYSILPDAQVLLALEPEELAAVVLEHLNSYDQRDGMPNRYNFSTHVDQEYPQDLREKIIQALMEAWVWLEREGLIAPQPGQPGDWVFVTRRGKRIKSADDLKSYRQADILPRRLLHPVIAQKVWSSFLRGDYDTSVFQAFKEVEIAVRATGGFSQTDIGVPLMRKAFEVNAGPLTDINAPLAEREALQHLFAGSIGSYKNPQSHRHVLVSEPIEAVEMIVLASHLLRIVDSRTSNP